MRTLLIDNYDSYTFNLYQLLAAITGAAPLVVRNDTCSWEELAGWRPDAIVVSPGPGSPENERDFGVCAAAIRNAAAPLLGVCLGHQGIACVHGGRVSQAPEVMHGRLSAIEHNGDELFEGMPQGFAAVRYHSLAVDRPLPPELEEIAWADNGVLMALRHRERPLWGVQFHPESIGTEHGRRLLENFVRTAHSLRCRGPASDLARPTAGLVPQVRARARPLGERYELVARELNREVDAESAFRALFGDHRYAFWLDSSKVIPGLSRFSFMGTAEGPLGRVLTYDAGSRRTTVLSPWDRRQRERPVSVFDILSKELQRRRIRTALPFDLNCGFVGFFGYELKAECGAKPAHRSSTPDAAFLFTDRMVAIDHVEHRTYVLVLRAQDRAGAGEDAWQEEASARLGTLSAHPARRQAPAPGADAVTFHLAHGRARYREDIAACKRALLRGDSYEICLTNRIAAEVSLDPLDTYSSLRAVNPAPYAGLLRVGELSVLSSSPERFLRISPDGEVESKPIKGTRSRGATTEEDRRLRDELASSAKDRAENLMIVDLLRNDLGLVCEIGSVSAPVLMDVESYETVHQLVSTIRGRLRAGFDVVDCVKACFPGGSMTGAPKRRTMEIIDTLEPGARGVYSGALGYLGLGGGVDLSIVIRTLVARGRHATIGSGGAITVLSDPDEEFEEMLVKARPLMEAAALAATGRREADAWRLVETAFEGRDSALATVAFGTAGP